MTVPRPGTVVAASLAFGLLAAGCASQVSGNASFGGDTASASPPVSQSASQSGGPTSGSSSDPSPSSGSAPSSGAASSSATSSSSAGAPSSGASSSALPTQPPSSSGGASSSPPTSSPAPSSAVSSSSGPSSSGQPSSASGPAPSPSGSSTGLCGALSAAQLKTIFGGTVKTSSTSGGASCTYSQGQLSIPVNLLTSAFSYDSEATDASNKPVTKITIGGRPGLVLGGGTGDVLVSLSPTTSKKGILKAYVFSQSRGDQKQKVAIALLTGLLSHYKTS